jgi:hypothetical protein
MLNWEKGNTPRQRPYQCQFFHHKCHMMECAVIILDPVNERMANKQDDEKPFYLLTAPKFFATTILQSLPLRSSFHSLYSIVS